MVRATVQESRVANQKKPGPHPDPSLKERDPDPTKIPRSGSAILRESWITVSPRWRAFRIFAGYWKSSLANMKR